MARSVSLKPFPYILLRDRGSKVAPEERTTWNLRRLSAQEREQISNVGIEVDRETDKLGIAVNQTAIINSYLRIGLGGWENFRDSDGNPVMFAPPELGMCAWANINQIDAADREELAHAIEKGNSLGETEIKN